MDQLRGKGASLALETSLQQASLVLASGSPRRRELLAHFDIPFAVVPSGADETTTGTGLSQVVELARRKGADVFSRHAMLPVLSADTLVCLDDRVLGKPQDRADACRMLRLLSGRWHSVHTGVCLHLPGGAVLERVETTRVRFTALSEDAIARYVDTGEPMDKAGAYAVQEIGGIFVERIEGSPSNVIGLPLATVAALFTAAGLL